MNQRISVTEIIQELVSQTATLVGSRDQSGDVEQLDRDGAAALDTCAVIGLAPVRDLVSCASAVDLEVAYRSLGVDGCEAKKVGLEVTGDKS